MSSSQQQSVGTREILGGVIAVIGVVVLLGWISAPSPTPPTAMPPSDSRAPGPLRELDDPAKASAYADDLARKSGGDLKRLSEQDQRWLDALTAGHSKEFLTVRSKALRAQSHSKHSPEKPLPKMP